MGLSRAKKQMLYLIKISQTTTGLEETQDI